MISTHVDERRAPDQDDVFLVAKLAAVLGAGCETLWMRPDAPRVKFHKPLKHREWRA